MKVTKMEGCGNDFVMVEINEAKNWELNELAKKLCNRHYGVGADGAIFVKKDPVEFVYYNSDGSYSPFCGNGMRCFAKYCVDRKIVEEKRFTVKCDQWNVMCEVEEDKVTVNIPSVEIEHNEIDGELIVVCGSKHKVIEVESLDEQEEKQSNRYNLSYVKVVDEQTIMIKTIERGAGPTLACGSGSYASALKINKKKKMMDRIMVKNPGGNVEIDIKKKTITGSADNIFEGEVNETALKREESAYKRG